VNLPDWWREVIVRRRGRSGEERSGQCRKRVLTQGRRRAEREVLSDSAMWVGVWWPRREVSFVSMVAQVAMSVWPRMGSQVPGALGKGKCERGRMDGRWA
jgi:hypothetical protein